MVSKAGGVCSTKSTRSHRGCSCRGRTLTYPTQQNPQAHHHPRLRDRLSASLHTSAIPLDLFSFPPHHVRSRSDSLLLCGLPPKRRERCVRVFGPGRRGLGIGGFGCVSMDIVAIILYITSPASPLLPVVSARPHPLYPLFTTRAGARCAWGHQALLDRSFRVSFFSYIHRQTDRLRLYVYTATGTVRTLFGVFPAGVIYVFRLSTLRSL